MDVSNLLGPRVALLIPLALLGAPSSTFGVGCGGAETPEAARFSQRSQKEPIASSEKTEKECLPLESGSASGEYNASRACLFPDDGPDQDRTDQDRTDQDRTSEELGDNAPLNVLGEPLATCSVDPLTGFRRSGTCASGPEDRGVHVVCAEMTEAFLTFTKAQGNDLSTPAPRYRFPGLKPGDRWCLCASRWREAFEAGHAPPVILEATERTALRFSSAAIYRQNAIATEAPSDR